MVEKKKKKRILANENKAPISPYSVRFHFSVPSCSEQASRIKSCQKDCPYCHCLDWDVKWKLILSLALSLTSATLI